MLMGIRKRTQYVIPDSERVLVSQSRLDIISFLQFWFSVVCLSSDTVGSFPTGKNVYLLILRLRRLRENNSCIKEIMLP